MRRGSLARVGAKGRALGVGARLPWGRLLLIAVALAFGAWLVVPMWLSTNPNGGSSASREVTPDVTLVTEQGELRLSDLRGQVVALYFSFPG